MAHGILKTVAAMSFAMSSCVTFASTPTFTMRASCRVESQGVTLFCYEADIQSSLLDKAQQECEKDAGKFKRAPKGANRIFSRIDNCPTKDAWGACHGGTLMGQVKSFFYDSQAARDLTKMRSASDAASMCRKSGQWIELSPRKQK